MFPIALRIKHALEKLRPPGDFTMYPDDHPITLLEEALEPLEGVESLRSELETAEEDARQAELRAEDLENAEDEACEQKERAERLLKDLEASDERAEALDGLVSEMFDVLSECSEDYNHPGFTDRHQTGPRLKELLAKVRERR